MGVYLHQHTIFQFTYIYPKSWFNFIYYTWTVVCNQQNTGNGEIGHAAVLDLGNVAFMHDVKEGFCDYFLSFTNVCDRKRELVNVGFSISNLKRHTK